MSSPKHRFMKTDGEDADEQGYFDDLIQIEPNEYVPGEEAKRMHLSLAQTRIIRGGLGGGKTKSACEHINQLCLDYPGSLHFIGRKDITSLKVTTQKEYLETAVRPATIDAFHVNDNTLYYKNGSIVLFRETKQRDKVKSLQLTSYMLDEADENEDESIWDFLDQRLRQKFLVSGEVVYPPYAGLLVFNPTNEDHWLYKLAQRKDPNIDSFKFSTYDNAHNLPPDYIRNLERRLAPWDRRRLLNGEWGRAISGNPVYHGFTEAEHVRPIGFRNDLPLIRAWDFGYMHPAVLFCQFEPRSGRMYVLREFLGSEQKLNAPVAGKPSVVDEVKRITASLCGISQPVQDFGDPHGADEKDNSVSSIEYLRIHHQIFVQSKRQRIKTGMDELQEKILARKPVDLEDQLASEKLEPLLVVDPQCGVFIDALLGGYHRDSAGKPVKDSYYDHLADCSRYLIVYKMNAGLASQRAKNKYRPRSLITGY